MKIYYREKSGGIEILRCFGIEGRVEIPGMIDDKLVISAAPYAFSSHMDEKEDLKNASLWEVSDGLGFGREEHVLAGNDVEEIVFPDTLKEIGRYIFYGCGNLKKLEFSAPQPDADRLWCIYRLPCIGEADCSYETGKEVRR